METVKMYNESIKLLDSNSDKWYKAEFEDEEFELMLGNDENIFDLFTNEYEEKHGIIFNIFEIDDKYNEIRTVY